MPAESVAFAYNGTNEVVVTISDATPGQLYEVAFNDGSFAFASDTAVGTTLELVIDTIDDPAPKVAFEGDIKRGTYSDPASPWIGAIILEYGNAEAAFAFGSPVWAFDGDGIVTCTLTGEIGESYSIYAEYTGTDPNGTGSSAVPGTGSPMTLTYDQAPNSLTGDFFLMRVLQDSPSEDRSLRLFSAGVAGAGEVSSFGAGEDVSSPLDPFGLGRFYEAPPWRFVITNLDGETQTWLDKLAFDRSVTFTRGQATVIDTGIPADNPEVNIEALNGDAFVTEGTRLVFAFRREGATPPWRIRAAGIILGLRDNAATDTAISTLTAYDPRQLLYRRAVTTDNAGALPSDDLGLIYLGATADAILLEQLDFMLAHEGAEGTPLYHAGLDWGWSAYYTGTIETTDAIDEITLSRGTSIGELMDKLEETGTCDLVIDPVWDPVNRPGVFGQLSIYARAGVAQHGAVFGWDTFPKNLVGIDRVVDGRDRVNDLQFYAGQGGPPVTPYQDAPSVAKYGRYFAQQFFPGQVSVPAVEAISRRVLTLQKNGQTTYAISPAAERAPIPLLEYRLFDTVPVYASNRFRQSSSALLRVESIPVRIGDDQLERVQQVLVAVDDTDFTPGASGGGGGFGGSGSLGSDADFGAGAPAEWRPFSATSPFNKEIPESPTLAPNSAAIVAKVTGWGDPAAVPFGVASSTLSPDSDFDHPLYFPEPTDPLFTIGPTGDAYSGWSGRYGTQIRIPEGARGANGSDAHMSVFDADTELEWDFYHFQYTDPDREVPAGGGPIVAKAGSAESLSGNGVVDSPYGGQNVPTDAAGFCLAAGVIRPEELLAGVIDHALSMLVHSTNGSFVSPAVGTAGSVDPTNAPPCGARFWLDETFAAIEALDCLDVLKTIYKSLITHGAYVRDTGSVSWYVSLSGGYPYILAGQPDPWREIAIDLGLDYDAGADYYLLDLAPGTPGVNHPDFETKLKVLDWTDPANR